MTFSADLVVINVQGLLLSKVDSIEFEYTYLQETWANKADNESNNFHNYVLGSYYSRSKYVRGGVGTWIRQGVEFKNIEIIQFCRKISIELCSVHLILKGKSAIILNGYRSPNGDFEVFLEQLENCLEFSFGKSDQIYLCGDFNVDFYFGSNDRYFKRMRDLLSGFNLFHTVAYQSNWRIL